MATQDESVSQSSDLELINIKIKKKYLELFKEICEENELNAEEELNSRLEQTLVDSFHHYSSKCMHKDRALRFLKGGKSCKRTPGFNLDQIEKLLSKMDSIEDQIEWLKNYLKQLQQTKQTMYSGPGLPTVMTKEEQYTSLTPYMQAYPQAIDEIRKKIRELEAHQIVEATVVHKM
ncbi:MAG: hypothetical protein HWN65_17885 [Candidatus Helarchaeota archaeon]|nr:hypothetical protein [Candidatus Helarchaeota archaeon]